MTTTAPGRRTKASRIGPHPLFERVECLEWVLVVSKRHWRCGLVSYVEAEQPADDFGMLRLRGHSPVHDALFRCNRELFPFHAARKAWISCFLPMIFITRVRL